MEGMEKTSSVKGRERQERRRGMKVWTGGKEREGKKIGRSNVNRPFLTMLPYQVVIFYVIF